MSTNSTTDGADPAPTTASEPEDPAPASSPGPDLPAAATASTPSTQGMAARVVLVVLLLVVLSHLHYLVQHTVAFLTRASIATSAPPGAAPVRPPQGEPPPSGAPGHPMAGTPTPPRDLKPTPPPGSKGSGTAPGAPPGDQGLGSLPLGGILAGIQVLSHQPSGSPSALTELQVGELIAVLRPQVEHSNDMSILVAVPQKVIATLTQEQRAFIDTHPALNPKGQEQGGDPLGERIINFLERRGQVKAADLPAPRPLPLFGNSNRNANQYVEGLLTLEQSADLKLTAEQAKEILPYMVGLVNVHLRHQELTRKLMGIVTERQAEFISQMITANGQEIPNTAPDVVLADLQKRGKTGAP